MMAKAIEVDPIGVGCGFLLIACGVCWIVATWFEKAPKSSLSKEQAWAVYQESK